MRHGSTDFGTTNRPSALTVEGALCSMLPHGAAADDLVRVDDLESGPMIGIEVERLEQSAVVLARVGDELLVDEDVDVAPSEATDVALDLLGVAGDGAVLEGEGFSARRRYPFTAPVARTRPQRQGRSR